ncbi:MAG: hypothetical protein QMD17_10230 [Rhodocyclaceae bacterium]|jgi:hypothetical protein|nr:hypothetical protein [Rhodocyclaceae bacterium]
MKALFDILKRSVASLTAAGSSGVFATRRESHLLHGALYATPEKEHRRGLEQFSSPASDEILSIRREAHLQLANIYAEMGRIEQLERRQPYTTSASASCHRYNMFGEQMAQAGV